MIRYICDCRFCEGHLSAVCQPYFPSLFSFQLDHVSRLPCHMLEFWPVECGLKWSSPHLGGPINKTSWLILYDVSLFPSACGGEGVEVQERWRERGKEPGSWIITCKSDCWAPQLTVWVRNKVLLFEVPESSGFISYSSQNYLRHSFVIFPYSAFSAVGWTEKN